MGGAQKGGRMEGGRKWVGGGVGEVGGRGGGKGCAGRRDGVGVG